MAQDIDGYTCPNLPHESTVKLVGKAGSCFVAALLTIRLFYESTTVVTAAAAAATLFTVAMTVLPGVFTAVLRRRDGPAARWEPTLLWRAQTFAFGFAGVCLLPAALVPASLYAEVVCSLLMVLMYAATFTEFCLGRIVYMLVVKATRAARA